MIINIRIEEEGRNATKSIYVNDCKCGKEPLFVTQWETKNNDPSTEIPSAYYIQCAFCDKETKVTSCKKAKTPDERLAIIENVVNEWNELVKATP